MFWVVKSYERNEYAYIGLGDICFFFNEKVLKFVHGKNLNCRGFTFNFFQVQLHLIC